MVGIDLPELIRLKPLCSVHFMLLYHQTVGIDLPELIRLKRKCRNYFFVLIYCRDWSAWIDTIETSILLPFCNESKSIGSGLICLNWYDWNNKKTTIYKYWKLGSGLICLNWYDWNFLTYMSTLPSIFSSGLICLNWYDWNRFLHVVLPRLN